VDRYGFWLDGIEGGVRKASEGWRRVTPLSGLVRKIEESGYEDKAYGF
jgi:hypothetical protein